MVIRVHNSMTRQKEDFVPQKTGKVGIYVCGVTTYDLCHVGHARVYVVFDTVVRWLRRDHQVTYVRNFTDVDDKIIRRAHERGEEPIALAARFADEFQRDMAELGVGKADVEPRVSTHIPEIVDFVQALVDKGFAYAVPSASSVDGAGHDVYFRVKLFSTYTQLSGRNLEDLMSGARVLVDERKEDPLDFALWKSAKPGEPFWESPFGKGRPGWHIECSAMSEKHLGTTFDIHGGGRDLVFPHHTNEIAQSECRHDGAVMARYWMHNGFVNFNDEKMSKSLGNFFTIRELLAYCTGEALRFFLLGTHYRSEFNFDVVVLCPACNAEMPRADQLAHKCSSCGVQAPQELLRERVRFPTLEEGERRVQYLYETRKRIHSHLEATPAEDGPSLEKAFSKPGEIFAPWSAFVEAMDDDFNTPRAMAALNDVLRVANLLVAGREKELIGQKIKPALRSRLLLECDGLLDQMCKALGLGEQPPDAFLSAQRSLRMKAKGIAQAQVDALLQARSDAKAQKDFAAADEARDSLVKLGIEVRDTPHGVEWTVT